jgi:hypothetical protein
MAVSARKAAPRGWIPSYYEFATHRLETSLIGQEPTPEPTAKLLYWPLRRSVFAQHPDNGADARAGVIQSVI